MAEQDNKQPQQPQHAPQQQQKPNQQQPIMQRGVAQPSAQQQQKQQQPEQKTTEVPAGTPQQVLGQQSPDAPLTEEERKEAISHGLDASAYRQLKAQGRL